MIGEGYEAWKAWLAAATAAPCNADWPMSIKIMTCSEKMRDNQVKHG